MTRTCVLWMVVSVDGYINGPGGEFIGPRWTADLDNWASEVAERFDTLLYGRAAWEGMASYWPNAETDPATPPAAQALARFMNGARKIVFSRTLRAARKWANSEIADADIRAVVAREMARPGRDIGIFPGARFAQTPSSRGGAARCVDKPWPTSGSTLRPGQS